MEDGLSRADFMNEDGHGRPDEFEIADMEGEIESAKDWLNTQIDMLITSAKSRKFIVTLTDDEKQGLRETLSEYFTYDYINERQTKIEGN